MSQYRDSSKQLVVNGGEDLCQVTGRKWVKAETGPSNNMLWSLKTGGSAPTIFSPEHEHVHKEQRCESENGCKRESKTKSRIKNETWHMEESTEHFQVQKVLETCHLLLWSGKAHLHHWDSTNYCYDAIQSLLFTSTIKFKFTHTHLSLHGVIL